MSIITIGGEPLDAAEQAVLEIVWVANAVGICPSFRDPPKHRRLKSVADRLVERGLLYRLTGELEPGQDADESGYALKGKKANWIAETLADASGADLHDLL